MIVNEENVWEACNFLIVNKFMRLGMPLIFVINFTAYIVIKFIHMFDYILVVSTFNIKNTLNLIINDVKGKILGI